MQLPTCEITVNEVGQLKFRLDNQTDQSWYLFTWQTPFDAWFSEFITIRNQETDQKVIYQGALAKRAMPNVDDYLTLPINSHQATSLDLTQVYSLSEGSYDIHLKPLRLLPLDVDIALPSQPEQFVLVHCPSTQIRIR